MRFKRNLWLFLTIWCCLTGYLINVPLVSAEYQSTYEKIQWGNRNDDTYYCIDIMDEHWELLYQGAACGENLHNFNPSELNLTPGQYHWKVWSPSVENYFEFQENFEGEFFAICGKTHKSSYNEISWGCRNEDTLYCVDIMDNNWFLLHAAIECKEDLHSFSPKKLKLPTGNYHWKVWSESAVDYFEYQEGFEGEFEATCGKTYKSTYNAIQWGCREGDSYYCVDIMDKDWNMLNQGIKCGEDLHSYAPNNLNLSEGTYHWKIWSPSAVDYFKYQKDFEGEFKVIAKPSGLNATKISSSQIYLTWSKVSGAVKYKIYKQYGSSYSSSYSYYGTSYDNKETITGLSADTTYCFKVKAVDSNGDDSSYSVRDCAKTKYKEDEFTWHVTDKCDDEYRINFKFYTGDGKGVWGKDGSYYTKHYGETVTKKLACDPREKICYGAKTGDLSWGVGYDDEKGCDNCCSYCGDGSRSINLTCPGHTTSTSNQDSGSSYNPYLNSILMDNNLWDVYDPSIFN